MNSDSQNPYQAPASQVEVEAVAQDSYEGLNRTRFFLWNLGIMAAVFVVMVLAVLVPSLMRDSFIAMAIVGVGAMIIGFAAYGVSFYLGVLRLKNIGAPLWWVALLVIPYINFLVWLGFQALPEGYADHRNLDIPAKVMFGVFFGMVAIVVLLIFLGI